MKQSIYPDPHGIDTWLQEGASRIFVHIVNTELWREITGEAPPATPITAKEYAAHGLPWFDLYDDALGALDPTAKLAAVKSVKDLDTQKSTLPLQNDDSVDPGKVLVLGPKSRVRDGDW